MHRVTGNIPFWERRQQKERQKFSWEFGRRRGKAVRGGNNLIREKKQKLIDIHSTKE